MGPELHVHLQRRFGGADPEDPMDECDCVGQRESGRRGSFAGRIGGFVEHTAAAGNLQSATVNTAFTTALQATVKDANNNPLSGVTVTFTAPSSGASGSFGGSATATAVTNASGLATAPALTANGTAGSYTVIASAASVSTPASFSLTNITASPASITATAGTSQSAIVNTAFASTLQAAVDDSSGKPLSGIPVTFTAPASGAAATFGGSATVTTNASGVATAPPVTANGTAGSYVVTASVAGVTTPASFSLTNTSAATAGTGSLVGSGNSATTTFDLTQEGTTDWIHWGDASLTRKSGVTTHLGNYFEVGSGVDLHLQQRLAGPDLD